MQKSLNNNDSEETDHWTIASSNGQYRGKTLSLDLHKKENYLVYYKNLQFYAHKGAQFCIKKRYKFREAPFLRPIMKQLTELRKSAKDQGNDIMDQFIKMIYSAFTGTEN